MHRERQRRLESDGAVAIVFRPEDPPGFVVRTELQKAASDNGFRLRRGTAGAWLQFGSTTAQGEIWLAGGSARGPWLLSLEHAGVLAELGEREAAPLAGPGRKTFLFKSLGELYETLALVYRLGVSLPDAPLRRFRAETAKLPRRTEAERLLVQRLGQDLFRAALLEYWGGRCPLTGISDEALLRASHIVPWKDCADDDERLDVHNGLLLSALWDAAFDRGLVTFSDEGAPRFSPRLSASARAHLHWQQPLALTPQHREKLAWHRARVFLDGEG